jgi:hypothetical protein
MSVRDLDRLADRENISQSLLINLFNSGLLVQRGNRVSFQHELFFEAFSAEAVIRRANGQVERILASLENPRHSNNKNLIIGAIDDDSLLARVLDICTDEGVISDCIGGICGQKAKKWAGTRVPDLFNRLREETRGLQFKLIDGKWEWDQVTFEPKSLNPWTDQDKAFLRVLPQFFAEGKHVDTFLDLIGLMDQRIAEEFTRLKDEAKKQKIDDFQSALFAITFVLPNTISPGISELCPPFEFKFNRAIKSEEFTQFIQEKLKTYDWSQGQIYMILSLCRVVPIGGTIMARFITNSIQRCWADAAYHLQLHLIEAASFCWDTEEADRNALIETIDGIPQPQHPFVNTTIMEALQSLGALEEEERDHLHIAREELKRCLANPNDIGYCFKANRIYVAQFDHPLNGAYYEAISELSEDDRKLFLIMAVKGNPEWAHSFLTPLIIELASLGDSETGTAIGPWSRLPPKNTPFQQDTIEVFVISHITLGRLGCPLPVQGRENYSPADKSLVACGEILYWVNRIDLDEKSKLNACWKSLSVLEMSDSSIAIDTIRHCEGANVEINRLPGTPRPQKSIVNCFPTEVLEICRRVLNPPKVNSGYFEPFTRFDRKEDLQFAIHVLSKLGSSQDLILLRNLVNNPELGTIAINAIKILEQRTAS